MKFLWRTASKGTQQSICPFSKCNSAKNYWMKIMDLYISNISTVCQVYSLYSLFFIFLNRLWVVTWSNWNPTLDAVSRFDDRQTVNSKKAPTATTTTTRLFWVVLLEFISCPLFLSRGPFRAYENGSCRLYKRDMLLSIRQS